MRQGRPWSCLLVGRGWASAQSCPPPAGAGAASGGVAEEPEEQQRPSDGGEWHGAVQHPDGSQAARDTPPTPPPKTGPTRSERTIAQTLAPVKIAGYTVLPVFHATQDFTPGFPCVDAIFQSVLGRLMTPLFPCLPPTQGRARATGSRDQGPSRSERGLPTETQNVAFSL